MNPSNELEHEMFLEEYNELYLISYMYIRVLEPIRQVPRVSFMADASFTAESAAQVI